MKEQVEQNRVSPPLDEKKAKNILFASFYFSQGDSDLQGYIFGYLHQIRPSWRVDDAFCVLIIQDEEFIRKASKVVLSNGDKHPKHDNTGKPIEPWSIPNNLETEADELSLCLNYREDGTINPLALNDVGDNERISTITTRIIERDHKFLIVNKGRPRGEKNKMVNTNSLSPYEDPYLSHFCYYVIEENKTGIEEFDEMFVDIRKNWNRSLSIAAPEQRPQILEELNQVIKVYNSHHESSKVSSDSLNLRQNLQDLTSDVD